MAAHSHQSSSGSARAGKLRIGNQWNAIRIIALSQSNPLKAIAEFVENSIDAKATNITVVRGKERGKQYLKVSDDGEGIDDLNYVATHIGDSIKRKLKEKGQEGLQGEFGIGLLSFWSVGEEMTLTSAGEDGTPHRLRMVKDSHPTKSRTPESSSSGAAPPLRSRLYFRVSGCWPGTRSRPTWQASCATASPKAVSRFVSSTEAPERSCRSSRAALPVL